MAAKAAQVDGLVKAKAVVVRSRLLLVCREASKMLILPRAEFTASAVSFVASASAMAASASDLSSAAAAAIAFRSAIDVIVPDGVEAALVSGVLDPEGCASEDVPGPSVVLTPEFVTVLPDVPSPGVPVPDTPVQIFSSAFSKYL